MAEYSNQHSTVRLSHSSRLNSESTQTGMNVPPKQSIKSQQKRSQSSSIQHSTLSVAQNQWNFRFGLLDVAAYLPSYFQVNNPGSIGKNSTPVEYDEVRLTDREYHNNAEYKSFDPKQCARFWYDNSVEERSTAQRSFNQLDILPLRRFYYIRPAKNSLDAQGLYLKDFALLAYSDWQDLMYDIANAQKNLLNMDNPSSWHADTVNMSESQKAKVHSHGYQFLSGDRSSKTQSLDCLSVSDQPFEGDEIAVTALHEEDICERGRVDSWKNGPGRKKEWRSIRYLTSERKRKRAECPVPGLEHASKFPSKATRVRLLPKKAPWQIAVPRNMLMQKSSSCHGSRPYSKPRSSMQIVRDSRLKVKYPYTQIWNKSDLLLQDIPVLFDSGEGSNLEDEIIDEREPPNTLEPTLSSTLPSSQIAASGPRYRASNAQTNSLNHLIPYEAFIDAIIGCCFRLKGLLRTELHYEVYAAESISDRNQKFEARAYSLRGLTPRERNYRVRNLGRASGHPSCIASLDQVGKKWLVFACCQDGLLSSPPKSHDPFYSTGEGYGRDDYESAFPSLDTCKPCGYKGTDKEGIKTDTAAVTYDHNFEKALEEELLTKRDAAQALDVVDRLRERVVAWFEPCPGGQKEIMKPGKQTKKKSPEQLQRASDRQRLKRQAKRLAKKSYVDSKTISGTIDRVAAPEVEHAWESKYNDLASNYFTEKRFFRIAQCIAMAMVED